MSAPTIAAPAERDVVTERVLADMPGRTSSAAKPSASPAKPTGGRAKPKPTPRRAQAAKSKPAAKRKPAPKPKPAATPKPKPAGKKAAKYPDWMADAVRRSRVISGRKINAKTGEPFGDITLAHPGPKQHLHIRAVIAAKIDGEPTPDKILALTGIKSLKALREIAEWKAPREAIAPMRDLGRACNDQTGWSTGRHLASALVAWIDQIRAQAKVA